MEAFTNEKLYIVADPEFEELEGYILIFLKALYGLKSSGERWAEVIEELEGYILIFLKALYGLKSSGERWAEVIEELEGYILIFLKALYGLKSSGERWTEVIHGIVKDMKFTTYKAHPCIWLRKAPNLRCYECVAVYLDDLCIGAESPSAIIDILKTKYNLKVKGDGKLIYDLGADYFEDPDGTFVSQPKMYIDKLAETYKRLFNDEPPKDHKTPLDKSDHPELDTSEIIEGDMAAK